VSQPPDELAAALRDVFHQEAEEHLEAAQQALRDLRQGGAAGPLAHLRRRLHTLKGAAATIGLADLAAATHQVEEALGGFTDDRLPMEEQLDLLTDAVEALRRMAAADDAEAMRAVHRELGAALAGRPSPVDAAGSERGARHLLRVEAERLQAAMDDLGELLFARNRVERRVEDLDGLTRDMRHAQQALVAAMQELGSPDREAHGRVTVRETEGQLREVIIGLDRLRATLAAETEALQTATAALRTRLIDVRMGPARSLLVRLELAAREAARREGKRVATETLGDDVDLDQIIVDRLAEALVHLVRNAVAHGIELPEERRRLGKPEAGRVRAEVRASRGSVEIDVSDDGAGIHAERLREALVQSKRATEGEVAQMTDERVLRRIFDAGFSTRGDVADELAGRGIGLDAVAAAVAGLGGEVVVDTEPGKGTRFRIWLPSTAAITHALIFKVGGQMYAVPAAAVVEIVHVELVTADRADRGEPLHLDDRDLPMVRLRPILGGDFPPTGLRRGPVIILEHEGDRFAITSHRVIGTREVAVKSLGPLLGRLPLLTGATVSGAGRVQLFLDVGELHALARDRRRRGRTRALTPRPLPGRRVLVADDSRSVREALAILLAQAGFTVEVVPDGWEAWERLQDHAFDVLITDLEMPRVHGWDLIAKCRSSPALRKLPIVVLTARTGDHSRSRAMNAGADAFSGKPLTRRGILDQIADAVAARQRT